MSSLKLELIRIFDGKKDLTVKQVVEMLGFDLSKLALRVEQEYLVFSQLGLKMEFRTAYWKQVDGREFKIYLHRIGLNRALEYSSTLYDKLIELEVTLEVVEWNGFPESLPTYPPCLVRSSHLMGHNTRVATAKRAGELGHFCFFNNDSIKADGDRLWNQAVSEFEKWFTRQQVS